MRGVTSFRYMAFLVTWTTFILITPIVLLRTFTVGPVSDLWIIATLVFGYFVFPKINAWLVHNTPFGRVWTWARANERSS